MKRDDLQPATQAAGWDQEAENWIAWARRLGHDSYWRFHRDQFLRLLPDPGRLTLDIGCGEGRLGRDLLAIGHRVVGIDRSAAMLQAAMESGGAPLLRGDAAWLPLQAGACDLAVAFMSLQDMDDMEGAVAEIARVLVPGGRLCFAAVHSLNSAGSFSTADPQAPFTIEGSYLETRRFADRVERDGLAVTFHQRHRSIEGYLAPLESAGLLVEAIREPKKGDGGRWDRVPLFLHVRAVKPAN